MSFSSTILRGFHSKGQLMAQSGPSNFSHYIYILGRNFFKRGPTSTSII